MNKLRHLLSALLWPAAVFPVPAGIVADPFAANGLFGLMANVNAYAESISSVATTGTNTVLVPAQLLAGAVLLNPGASGAYNVTLPSTGSIIAALGNTIPLDGSYSERITFVQNGAGQTATIVAGDGGTTIVGPAIVASNVARTYLMRILGSAQISLTNMGQLPL